MAYSAPTTKTTGDLITAAIWNQDVVDNQNAAFPLGVAAWTNWTPTITQSGSVTFTITRAKYQRIVGRFIICQADLAITGAGTTNNAITVGGLPAASAGNGAEIMGSFRYFDNGTGNYSGTVQGNSTTSVQFYVGGTQSGAMGVSPNFATANGDVFRLMFQYEAAS